MLKSVKLAIVSISVLLLRAGYGYTQEPAYFILGEKELANTDIYSINQGADERLFIATNNGLMEYKHGRFEAIPWADERNRSSLFNINRDQNGDLFCCNFKGQIFKLVGNTLTLYYTLNREYLGPMINFVFDDNNELIIGSALYANLLKGKVLFRPEAKSSYQVNKLPDGRLILNTSCSDSLHFVENNSVKSMDVSSLLQRSYRKNLSAKRKVVLFNGKLTSLFTDGSIELMENKHLKNEVPPIENETYCQFKENEIFALGHTKGVRTLHATDSLLYATDRYFNQFKISAVAQGTGQTVFYGTFGRGLLVVHDTNVKTHGVTTADNALLSVAADDSGNVFITQRGKGVVHYNGKWQVLCSDPVTELHKIFYTPGANYGVSKEFPALHYFTVSLPGIVPAKDICQISNSTSLIASAHGVFKIGNDPVFNNGLSAYRDESKNDPLLNLTERCQSVVLDPENQVLYVSTQLGVLTVNAENKKEELLFNGKSLSCTRLVYHDGKIWCATTANGILVFKDGLLVQEHNRSNGLGNNYVAKIAIRDNKVYVSHKSGFQVFDLATQVWTTLGPAEGIIGAVVSDFALGKDQLWLLANNSLLSIDTERISSAQPHLTLYLDSVVVSGVNIDSLDGAVFSAQQNHCNFYLNFRNVSCLAQSIIRYRIVGFEAEWNTVAATANLIEYKSLPPGNYTFEAKVAYGNTESELISSSFQIAHPYWQQWWFIPMVILLTSVVLFSGFWYRLKAIRMRNRELLEKQKVEADLLETELKALRSQMNPHFIFNSLNSIQDLILKERTEDSYDYIVLFADLVRSTLNYSNKEFIPIEKELEFLDVYLSLEKLRFKDEFTYDIEYNGSTDIEVPSLIVQPFIENALVHGLLHKEGHKNLTITFKLEEQLICLVRDNGIGRKRAKEIQQRQGRHYESFALGAIKKRLAILTEQYGEHVGYSIHDLQENGESTGTCAEIVMPYSRKF